VLYPHSDLLKQPRRSNRANLRFGGK